MKKKLTVMGTEVTVGFNLATEIGFETLTDKPFSLDELKSVTNQQHLVMAAIMSQPESKTLPDGFFDRLLTEGSIDDARALNDAVAECMMDFLHIPQPSKEAAADAPESPKN